MPTKGSPYAVSMSDSVERAFPGPGRRHTEGSCREEASWDAEVSRITPTTAASTSGSFRLGDPSMATPQGAPLRPGSVCEAAPVSLAPVASATPRRPPPGRLAQPKSPGAASEKTALPSVQQPQSARNAPRGKKSSPSSPTGSLLLTPRLKGAGAATPRHNDSLREDTRELGEEPVWQPDEKLQMLAQKLSKAWLAFCQKQAPTKAGGGAPSWSKFFLEVNPHGKGTITFEQFDSAIRHRLKASIKRYELRVFWKYIDEDGSGQITCEEFMRVMYRIELSTWPEISREQLSQVVRRLNAEADKWHHAGGNWFKIFSQIDTDGSGSISYDELTECVRGTFPGLRIPAKDIPESLLQGMWKLLDRDCSVEVPVHRFMSFMRKHGGSGMFRLTEYAKKKRGLVDGPADIGEAPERSMAELRTAVARMEKALKVYCHERGHGRGEVPSVEANWTRFLQDTILPADTKGDARFQYFQLERAILEKLGRWVVASPRGAPPKHGPVEKGDIRALWELLDPDKSGEVSLEEFHLAVYRLKIDGWPDGDDQNFERMVNLMNTVVIRRFRCGGNWYKVFNLVDSDGSGRLEYKELEELVRDSWGGLAITPAELSEAELRAFWKGLDRNKASFVTVADFMVFMRRHGSKHGMHKLTSYAKGMRGIDRNDRFYSSISRSDAEFSAKQMCAVATRITLAIHGWSEKRKMTAKNGSASSPEGLWGSFIAAADSSRHGRITFGEFERNAKSLLRIQKTVADDELWAFWRAVDEDESGEAGAAEFDSAVYRLQVKTWPVLDPDSLRRIIGVMNAAADKWHRCGGNWYKVFRACDEDGSGSMDYDEMVANLRSGFPGLSILQGQVSDADMRGLWRALDAELAGCVDVKNFMVFMRQHGKDFSMHKLTAYAMAKRGLMHDGDGLGPAPSRTPEQLRATAQALNNALSRHWKRRGISMSSTLRWGAFFKECEDLYKAGRFGFHELKQMLRSRLLRHGGNAGHEESMMGASRLSVENSSMYSSRASFSEEDETVIRGVSHDDFLALWVTVQVSLGNPSDGMKKISGNDWYVGLYQVELEHWPEADEVTLTAAADVLSAAADKWHRAAGNWYKVFNLVDSEGSGHFGFEEMVDMIRRPLPCLAIPPERLPEIDIKMFWKALDADLSGEVTVTEFMIFMRRMEARRGNASSPRAAAGSVVQRALASRSAAQQKARTLTVKEHELLSAALQRAPPGLIAEAWQGAVSEWDWYNVVREVFKLGEVDVDDDAVFVAWRLLDPDGTGKVEAHALALPAPL